MTDCDGNMAWTAKHKAWGQADIALSRAARDAGVTNPFRFQGQYFDEESGLHYNRHRYYDPHSGRFVSKDPIGLRGGSNSHAYVSNPVGWVDPLGLKATQGGCKGGRFSSADSAARAALTSANPKSIRDNLEYGGLIYKTSNRRYDFTKPVRGTDAGVQPYDALGKVPGCAKVVGDYHTHGDYSVVGDDGRAIRTSDPQRDNYRSDSFSGQDFTGIRADAVGKSEYTGYLGTPSGKFRSYNPKTRKDSLL
jgi:RHS repeat-associated protein